MRRVFLILTVTGALGAIGAVLVASSGAARPRSSSSGSVYAAAPRASKLTRDVTAVREATAKYVTNLARAKADGYGIITKMIPDMGYHFLNPSVKGFSVRRPPILVYEHRNGKWQLGAVEWVFPSMPAKPPLPGATYGAFGAACHYKDGTFVFEDSQAKCPASSPKTGAAFNFWHPNLVTLHFWVWFPNPQGIYRGTNPMVQTFNKG